MAMAMPETMGTTVADASDAASADGGLLGTVIVNASIHTETHERPRNGDIAHVPVWGCRYSAQAMPMLPSTW